MLDLAGNGIKLTDLASSHMYYDMAGDGYQHRTAWAGEGNAVLVLDTAGNGQITQRNQIVFTDWDPAAETDMQSLANVFDTNQNGKLSAANRTFRELSWTHLQRFGSRFTPERCATAKISYAPSR